MDNNFNVTPKTDEVKENVLAGIVGAFVFGLAGGLLWFVLYLVGFFSGLSGLVGVVCAIKGYAIFSKKESTKGIIIATVMALLVLVLAWYLCFAYDIQAAYQIWYEEGEIDFTLTYAESIRAVPIFLSDRSADTKVEIQIRTVAMDFWASLEHKMHSKFEGDAPEHIRNELIECAKMVSDLDARMLSLNDEILALTQSEENE